MSPLGGPVEVRVPARADALRILRAVAAGVGARLDLSIDAIDELRIAVDEAATLLLRTTDDPVRLLLRLDPVGDALTVELSTDGRALVWPPDGVLDTWPWLVITGLVDEADLVDTGSPTVRFRTRRQGAG